MDVAAGCLNEIIRHLEDPTVLSDQTACRNLLAKVMNLISRGIDVTSLSPHIAKLLAHHDPLVKKFACEFVCVQIEKSSDLVLLVINSLLRDCKDSSPMTRGLSLRTLCSLRQESASEHILQAIQNGLNDHSSYVRRIAALSSIRLHHLNPESILDTGIIDKLYSLIRDPDPIVVVNCLMALEEILKDEGGVVINQKMSYHLLITLPKFTNWGRTYVLSLLKKYVPKSEDEVFNILNILDDYLKETTYSVFMSSLELFLHLITAMPHLKNEVLNQCKEMFVSGLNSGNIELTYSIILFIENFLDSSKSIFSQYHKAFFCRFKEPPYLKMRKIEILPSLVTSTNFPEILDELRMYCSEVSSNVSFCAMKAIGKIAKQDSLYFEYCIKKLEELLEIPEQSVQANVFQVLELLDLTSYVHLENLMRSICSRENLNPANENGCCANLFLLGEYGYMLESSPYAIQEFIENYIEECTDTMKAYLLTAVMKLFLTRPAECQHMLGGLLEICSVSRNKDLNSKALYYYNLLKQGPENAKRIVLNKKS
ncbi:AP-4 complex subunit beta-1 isoform X1 [Octopus vulgaris]|uniref:AP-4 complex subunit beta-1 isoform X1 n=2 Tax=Octopus TaxID=6643 RepID=A0AA36ALH7_OCTVU|nr:AP-4 complex subunit beta-1 [Octopus sinensis]CAI9716867.1 AP-4 complex subunit beta-1 isoform X1 [Octopus vulgaris]